jgi:hypothetical protein
MVESSARRAGVESAETRGGGLHPPYQTETKEGMADAIRRHGSLRMDNGSRRRKR